MLSPTIRVSLIEDRAEIREGLSRLIGGSPGFEVTGVFGSMEEAISNIGLYAPDVALVDLGLPGMSGIEGIRVIRENHPNLQMLVLSVYEDDDRVFEALCAGASGYLLKKTPSGSLLAAIGEVMNGGAPMSPEIARKVLVFFREVQPAKSGQYHLTPHELRLLRLLVEGHNYKTAATELNVTVHAVSFHLRNVYEKLHVHSKSEAVAKALRDGLVR